MPWNQFLKRINFDSTMAKDMETISLELLCDMRAQLGAALISVKGENASSMLDRFLVGMAIYINQAAEGYILLRKSSRIDGSKLLIRPAIEAMILIKAVTKAPPLLYRIACTEVREHRRWARLPSIKAGVDYDAEEIKKLSDLKLEYRAQFPKHKLEEKELSLYDAAKAANAESYYNGYYRLYCKFTHPTLGPVAGSLNHFDTEDNPAVATCVLCGLEVTASAGGEVPNLASLRTRLFSLDESGSAKNQSS
jgi:hypothetical protein